jgi:hypothetical protein
MKDVCVLETLQDQCAMLVGLIGTERIAVSSLGRASSATRKEDVFPILRNVSVKNSFPAQLAPSVPQNFSALVVPDFVIPSRHVMVKEFVTQTDFAS